MGSNPISSAIKVHLEPRRPPRRRDRHGNENLVASSSRRRALLPSGVLVPLRTRQAEGKMTRRTLSGALGDLNRRGRKGLGSTILRMAVVSGLMAGLTLLVVPAAEAQSTNPYTTLNIAVGSDTHGVAVDGATNTVYAANYGSNTVSVIDGATNTVTATVGVGAAPYAVAIDQTTDIAYVANSGSNTVSVINGATKAVTATVNVGSFPVGVAVDQTTDTVFVSNVEGDSVSVIDAATDKVTSTIDNVVDPLGVAVDARPAPSM
jgi:YVTN family beta-propeller protein